MHLFFVFTICLLFASFSSYPVDCFCGKVFFCLYFFQGVVAESCVLNRILCLSYYCTYFEFTSDKCKTLSFKLTSV